MHLRLTIVCLLLASQVNGQQMFFDDNDAAYNPCQTDSGVFFYPHPTDIHQYYQCDESGVAYLRSCGDLVWDEIRVSCNWPAAVAATVPGRNIGSSSTLPPFVTDTSSTTTITTSTSVEQSSSTTTVSSPSLCITMNPCGEHGTCLEPPALVVTKFQRFACVCDDNWFGRLCNHSILDLTTPPTTTTTPVATQFDQNSGVGQIVDSLLLPVPLPETVNNTSNVFNSSEKLQHLDSPFRI